MLRKFGILLVIPFLAACGQEDFTLNVDRSAAIVSSELTKIDPNVLVSSSGLELVKTENPDGNTVRFLLPSAKGGGEVVFEVASIGPQQSELKVTVEIPRITRDSGDGESYEYLDESAVETSLKEALSKWEKAVEAAKPTDASLAELSELVSVLAIGLQDFEQFESLAGSALFAREVAEMESAATESEWAETAEDWGDGPADEGWGSDNARSESSDEDMAFEDSDWGAGSY